VIALKNHLDLDCEMRVVDRGKGDQLTPEYIAMNPNKKMPVLEDDGFVLWESNAILFYLASKKPQSGLWPSDLKGQADVPRWLAWESYGRAPTGTRSRSVWSVTRRPPKARLGLVPADPAFYGANGTFDRFAAALNQHLKGRTWLTGKAETTSRSRTSRLVQWHRPRNGWPVTKFPKIARWYDRLAALPAWQASLVRR
jgi:glutathione S-transferase